MALKFRKACFVARLSILLSCYSISVHADTTSCTGGTCTVTTGGNTYTITLSNSSFTSQASALQAQPIWGNSALATTLATDLGFSISFNNGMYNQGPRFAYGNGWGVSITAMSWYSGMGGLRVNNDGLDPSGTGWALVSLVPSTTNITGTGNLSAVGGSGSLNPIFQGGTLKVDSATTTSTAFTIKATGGKIDANGLRAVFSGAFSNAVGESGKLTITNTGTAGQGAVVLSTANTYSGGTEVQAGAVLSIASSDALGSGTLALVGSSTVPATLTTTATTTISNAITVTGDPVFNVAPNTTTTVSAAITDGVSAGDVVVSGGGTLALTAVNTYTALCKG